MKNIWKKLNVKHINKTQFSWDKMTEKLDEILKLKMPDIPKPIELKLPQIKKISLPKPLQLQENGK